MFCCGDPWSVPTVSKVLLSCSLISSLSLFQAVHTLIALQKRYLDSLGKLTPAEEDSVWQVIIGQRAKVSLHCSLRLEVFKEKHLVLFFFVILCKCDHRFTNRLLYICLGLILILSWQVNDRQEDCKHFESTWFSAMKLCEAAAEAAYTSGVLFLKKKKKHELFGLCGTAVRL